MKAKSEEAAELWLKTCRDCRFWVPGAWAPHGTCHRNAPRPVTASRPYKDMEVRWPPMAASESCGDFKGTKQFKNDRLASALASAGR